MLNADTENACGVGGMTLDIAFVTPWIYKAVRGSSARIDAARVVIYHHTARDRVEGCVTPCEVPAQGARWSLAGSSQGQ